MGEFLLSVSLVLLEVNYAGPKDEGNETRRQRSLLYSHDANVLLINLLHTVD